MCKPTINLFAIITGIIVGMNAAERLAQAAPQSKGQHVEILAEAMRDSGCAEDVSRQLYATPGVKVVNCDMKTQVVSITLSQNREASLDRLWKAVAQGNGKPTRLMTSEATYTLSPSTKKRGQPLHADSAVYVVIDNLHCKGCAKKIAAQLYVIPGVTEVRVDMPTETLLIKMQSSGQFSPWRFVNAVRKAKERPLSITGPLSNLKIVWASKQPAKNHHHAQNQSNGGTLR